MKFLHIALATCLTIALSGSLLAAPPGGGGGGGGGGANKTTALAPLAFYDSTGGLVGRLFSLPNEARISVDDRLYIATVTPEAIWSQVSAGYTGRDCAGTAYVGAPFPDGDWGHIRFGIIWYSDGAYVIQDGPVVDVLIYSWRIFNPQNCINLDSPATWTEMVRLVLGTKLPSVPPFVLK